MAVAIMGVAQWALATPVLVKTEKDILEYKLDNGLRVVLAPNPKENKVYMNTIYFTGSLDDPKGKGGLAHLLEHLAFKGTTDVQGEEFQRLLDQYTLNNNASTDYYSTRYINTIRPDEVAINKILHLEAQRMDQLVLQQKFVPTEIEIVRREREIRLDQPFAVLLDDMWKAAYGNEYLGRLPIGDLQELTSINMQELEQFYRRYYVPNNAAIVIAGKFNVEHVLKQIDQNFSAIKPKPLPAEVQVPLLDSTKIKQREFTVQKGSDLAKFNIYLNGRNLEIQPALALVPYLYAMQPSGHLYKNMVETGISTATPSTTWMDKDFNLVLLGAVYAPTQDAKKVSDGLFMHVEQGQAFTQAEIDRIKAIVKNAQATMMTDSVAVGTTLSDYIVSHQGDWAQFFSDQNRLQNLKLEDVNSTLKTFLTAKHRISGHILPTPEDQKKAQQQAQEEAKTLDQTEQVEEPLKDPSVYKAEVKQFITESAALLQQSEQKIQRGQFDNGLKYAIFPTETRDNRIYATLNIDFGDEKSLFGKGQIIDFMSYLLLRGSAQYTLQDITDKSIALDGKATASSNKNSITIAVSAKKENFAEYFKFILELLKQPNFEQKEFDLLQAQSLQGLDRPYTEPDVVTEIRLGRLLEQYQAGDLRYHFEPEFEKQQIAKVTQAQVKQLYQDYFAMNHAQIAVTGELGDLKILELLEQSLAQWNSQQKYHAILPSYHQLTAKKVHGLAEQREFGSYQSVMMLPVGADHKDAPALIVFSHIFGESQLSSRLAKELREKKALVYGFGRSLNLNSETDVGALSIGANYTAGRSAQVSQTIHKVLVEMINKGVTEQELEAAKADILKGRVTQMEDERTIHRMLVNQLGLDKTMKDRAIRDQAIASLTVAEVNAAIKKYIKPEHMVEVMSDQYGQPD